MEIRFERIRAMVHSKNEMRYTVLLGKAGDNDYIFLTEDSIVCHGIYNPFSGLYYVDDKYTQIKVKGE